MNVLYFACLFVFSWRAVVFRWSVADSLVGLNKGIGYMNWLSLSNGSFGNNDLLPKEGKWSHVPSILIHSHHSILYIMLILALYGVLLVSFCWCSLFALELILL